MKLRTLTFTVLLAIPLSFFISCSTVVDDGSGMIAGNLLDQLWSTPGWNWLTYSDPANDYFETFVPYPDIHDILSVSISGDKDGNILTLIISFNEKVMPAIWSGDPAQLFGYVEIDADRNPSTGEPSLIDNQIIYDSLDSPLTGMGVDYIVSLHDYDGFFQSVMVYRMDPNIYWDPAGIAHVLYHENTCVLEIPLVVMGDDDGNIDFGLYIGTEPGATDITEKYTYTH